MIASLNLAKALEFLGYKDLDPKNAEGLSSGELMDKFPDKILSAAFFAPKITDVSVSAINVGWRKVIRLKAQGDAAKKGIDAGFLLFNKFQGEGKYDKDPFARDDKDTESQNTQLILTRADGASLKRSAYFLVFGRLSDRGRLITFLLASFDVRAPKIVTDNKYYVPNACKECHGGKFDEAGNENLQGLKLNYLDTDHWFDRLEDQDFGFLKNISIHPGHPFPVLYDADKDGFEAAFNIFRLLNTEIQAQNARAEPSPSPTPGDPSFQLRAVTKWLDLHRASSTHQDVFARALPSLKNDPWNAGRNPDKELLPLLNQYCFRCHSSVRFNVFDRPAVVKNRIKILKYLNLSANDKLSMPQDRNLNCSARTLADKNRIFDLVSALGGPTPTPTPTPFCPSPTPTPH